MAAVLVTDGEQRAALAVVRSLGRAGHDVFVCSAKQRSLAGTSRFVNADALVPDPHAGATEYVSAVRRLVDFWDIQVLLPIAEVSALAILAEQASLRPVTVPFPSYDRFVRACDKRFVLEAASGLGIGVPRQRTLMTPDDAAALDARDLEFPLVVKPARSIIGNGRGVARSRLMYVADEPDLRRAIGCQPNAAFPLLLQERIVGPGVGIFLLIRDGNPLAVFSHRRIREKPPSGGVSVYREGIPADPRLVALSQRLLESLHWDGVAMIEYKLDSRSGAPYLMEINGRFWGSLQLAIDSGVDFPAMLVELALGGRPEPVLTYPPGVKSWWLLGDVDHMLARLRHSRDRLALPPEAPGRTRVIAQFVSTFADRAKNEVLRLNDPMPAFHELLNWARAR